MASASAAAVVAGTTVRSADMAAEHRTSNGGLVRRAFGG